MRYFLTFLSSGVAVQIIALLHKNGGFDLVMAVMAAIAAVLLVAVVGFAVLASGVENGQRRAVQPAE